MLAIANHRLKISHRSTSFPANKGQLLLFGCFFFWPCRAACVVLVSQPEIEPRPSAVKAHSTNLWTAREFQRSVLFCFFFQRSVLTDLFS